MGIVLRSEDPLLLTRRDLVSLSPPPRPREGLWLHLSREAMACRFELTVPEGIAAAAPLLRAALDEVDRIEAQLSVFRETSEIARLNREAAAGPVVASPEVRALLALCAEISRATDGAFDVTAAPLSRCWGFASRRGRLPDPAAWAAARACVGWQGVALDDAAGTVRFARAGMALDLGSVGKGYALDRVAEALRAAGVRPALLSAGSSSVLALGAGAEGRGFRVGLRDPRDHARRLAIVSLRDRALGVSGIGEQSFEAEGRRWGHLFDPRTGEPVTGRLLSAVVAPTAAEADALATAFFAGGAALARRYVADDPRISALFIEEGAVRPLVIGERRWWRVLDAG